MSSRKSLGNAIDLLADRVEHGHLLASMGGEDLLIAAADKIANLESGIEELMGLYDAVGEYLSVVGVCGGAEGDDPLCGDPVCPYCHMVLAAERCRTVLEGG